MGCLISTPKEAVGYRRPAKLGEVAIYVPGLRIPKSIDFRQPLADSVSIGLIDRLSALRMRVIVMTAQEASQETRTRWKTATQHGGSTIADLLQALEDYLPVLLGLAKDGAVLKYKVQFAWINKEDDTEETVMSDVSYEILSVLHLMATLCLSEANALLLPKASADVSQLRTPEESRRAPIDVLLKAAGYLDCAVLHVLPQIPLEERSDLPIDLADGKLRALCMQALGQGIDLQLGLAIDSPKATLAVKRRLACEMVKCWQQAQENITQLRLNEGWGKKHRLFVEWKYNEAKAAAYYYHGLILDEGNTEKSHGMAVASLQAAEEFLKESRKACEAFNSSPPISRIPPIWGSMKHLSEKIPKDVSSKVRINRDLYNQQNNIANYSVTTIYWARRFINEQHALSNLLSWEQDRLWDMPRRRVDSTTLKYHVDRVIKGMPNIYLSSLSLLSPIKPKIMETAPSLPDFMIALKPDDYQLPPLDHSWTAGETNQSNM